MSRDLLYIQFCAFFQPLKTNGQISEINGKADGSIAALNGHCKDEISAEGGILMINLIVGLTVLSPDKDVAKTEKSPKEEKTPVESVDINAKTSPDEADANEVEKVEIIEMEEKENDINESFRNFFSNIGLKLTVKKGSGEKAETDVPEEVPNIPEEVKDNAQEVKSENEEQSVDLNTAQEANEYDSTTCPSLTDGISENIPENADIKETETKEEELHPASPMITEEKVAESPLKRFFTTGIFSSLRKKKKLAEDEVTEKELVDMGKNEIAEIAEQAVEEQDKEEITLDTEAATTEKGLGEAKIMPAVTTQNNVKPPSMERSDGEGEMLNSQEKEKVQASPLKKLMSGSSFRSLSKKQKAKKSSDTKITDSQEQVSDQLLSSTESAENQKDESPAQPSAPAAEEEDSAWAAFKKLLTPKKRNKTPSLSNEQAQISGSVDEAKPSEGEQISDHSTEEGKKRKDSSVSWEAVLCGSGRRKSRKSSDSEEETSQNSKQDSGLKQGAESPLERSNEAQEIKEGSPPESDGESTWKSFKKLVTPKTKAKDLDESKDIIPSDNEVTQAESTFSIKNLLPGRKKRKPAETLEQVSLDEADKEASDDEDSETPAVIPLSEFADEMGETKADVESYIPEEALENEVPKTLATPAPVEEPDDVTESISKHQQLSDIPEEGVLTETMATPASGIEEAARDDTIAEDLVEITSEAITAPEPVDVTVTDETEMISAVSQLSDSSKTSGNATPVPAEYSVNNTELLLEQVAETISVSTHVVPVTLEQPSSERIVSSVSPQLLETFEKEQPKILEIHKGSDETVVNAELNAEPIDAINELEATAQTESIPDVNKAVSTEIVSEIVSEETDNAEVTEDEVHEVSVTQVQESIKELEVTDDSQHVLECISEEKEELPQETLPEAEAVDETVTAAYVPSVEEEEKEASNDQVHEETCVDSAEASEEPKYDEDVSTAQVSVEGEKADELQGTKVITAATEHAVVMQVITCNLKDVSAVIPDVLIEETTEIREHLIERKASEMEVKDTFETTTPLEKDNVINTAEEGSVVVMMHVPSQEFDNNHRFQVQVVDVDINSAENIVNTMIEVGVTEAKEVIDVCHETLEKVENLSASTAIEEEVNNEENNLTVQEVIQHVKENLPEPTPESVPDELEQEVIKQPDVSETLQSASSEPEDEKMMKDSSGELMEEEDEGHGIPAEQKESEDQLKTSDLGLDISTHDHKEDLEETKAEQQKSEVCVTAEDATALSEELAKKKDGDTTTEAQRLQSTQSQIVTPNNTGLVAPQNTGMISSIGNVESPSSLSLEFKLNIQFGQLKAPASPPPPAEPVKQLHVSEAAVQAVEAVEPTNLINAMQRVESEKQMELMEVAVQTTEITESEAVVSHPPKLQDAAVQEMETTQPAEQVESKEPIISKIQAAETTKPLKQITEPAEKLDLTERSMISKQPVLEAVSIQTIETIEPVEQIQSKQSIIPDIQATQTTEPVMQKEKRGLLISHPAVFKARSKEKTAEEPIKQIEEENDDVWLDAEEDIYTQEEKGASHIQVEEPTEPQAGSAHEEKDPESEFEMAPDTKSEDEESHQRVHETGGTGEIESEGEDFAVALEYPVITTCVTQAEWD
uniref:A kinase-anchoring proteins AKAP-5 and AKAP-12 calmodulin (CaM)-binding domain-containing protein n=1 Tax=Oreochromis aureus TaxID=47969 RepID=A0A668VX68_OREAU